VQRLLNVATWGADAVLDDLREYVVEHLGEASSAVLIVDETGFLKKDSKSCGVARQDAGTAGAVVNTQVGVFLCYASDKGAAFIDRALSLPHTWTVDHTRRFETDIPTTTACLSTIEFAKQLLTRAFAAGVPARWIIAALGYGRSHAFRCWLEGQGRADVVMVPSTNAAHVADRRHTVEKVGAQLREEDWTTFTPTTGTPGQAWARVPLSEVCPPGMQRWLIIRCLTEDPDALTYFVAYGPNETTCQELVRRNASHKPRAR